MAIKKPKLDEFNAAPHGGHWSGCRPSRTIK
jgi:hypothetical protein